MTRFTLEATQRESVGMAAMSYRSSAPKTPPRMIWQPKPFTRIKCHTLSYPISEDVHAVSNHLYAVSEEANSVSKSVDSISEHPYPISNHVYVVSNRCAAVSNLLYSIWETLVPVSEHA